MNEFTPYTYAELVKATDKAVKEISYIDIVEAIKDIEETPIYRDDLVRESRRLVDKRQRTGEELAQLEAIWLTILRVYKQAELENEGKS